MTGLFDVAVPGRRPKILLKPSGTDGGTAAHCGRNRFCARNVCDEWGTTKQTTTRLRVVGRATALSGQLRVVDSDARMQVPDFYAGSTIGVRCG